MNANFDIELTYPNKIIAGIDESGRGPLAGPVIAAIVIIDPDNINYELNDSKKLSVTRRELLYKFITDNYIYAISEISPQIIDEINIYQATKLAFYRCYEQLNLKPDIVLIDGNMKFAEENFISIVKGDQKSLSIAAASIVAKVTRDRIMQNLHLAYPYYSWHTNKGYPTQYHARAIYSHGITPHHRKSFRTPLIAHL